MQTKHYLKPACKEVEMEVEAILCASIQSQDFNNLDELEMV
jgi:hypothetical protein